MTIVAFADMKTETLRIYKDTRLKDAMTAEWERMQADQEDPFNELDPFNQLDEDPEMDCS